MSYRSHNITILVYKLIKSIDLLRKNKMQKKESTCNFHDLTNGNNILFSSQSFSSDTLQGKSSE